MGVGFQRQAPAILPLGNTRYSYRMLGGPQGTSRRVRKISSPPGFDPRTVQPVASRYADWAIPVFIYIYICVCVCVCDIQLKLLSLYLPKGLLKSARFVTRIVSFQGLICRHPSCWLHLACFGAATAVNCMSSFEIQFQTLVHSFRKCHALSASKGKEKGMWRFGACFVLLEDAGRGNGRTLPIEQSESCVPGGDVYVERKAQRSLFNRREIPSFLPTDSNMIYIAGIAVWRSTRGNMGAELNLYKGVTDYMIRFV